MYTYDILTDNKARIRPITTKDREENFFDDIEVLKTQLIDEGYTMVSDIQYTKDLLRKEGYFTDNLWHVNDVQENFQCDEETAPNTEEISKVIAEFIGWKKSLGITYHKDKKVTTAKHFDFVANGDWNGLMEVVEKIENLGSDFSIKSNWSPFSETNIHQTTIKVFKHIKIHSAFDTKEVVTIHTNPNENKLESVYDSCIKFIEWYNQQNKQHDNN